MIVLQRAEWILGQLWLFTLPGTLVFLLAVLWPGQAGRKPSAPEMISLLMLLIFPVSILFVSSAFWHTDGSYPAPSWPANVLATLMLLHIIVAVYFGATLTFVRVRAVVAGLSSVWISLWILFIGIMAVTNDWI